MAVSLQRDGDIAVILIDNPPVNAASHAVRAGLVDALLKGHAASPRADARRVNSAVRSTADW